MINDKKVIKAWYMYDWANSVYNLVINTSIFPIYYTAITSNEANNDLVNFFGFEIVNSVLYSYALSISYLLSASILPLLSGIADFSGKKKFFLKIFTFIGAFSCMGMFFFTEHNIEWGILCVVFASLGYSSGLVFYDAFLPEIASEDQTDKISANGYAYGYAGSALMLIMSLVLLLSPTTFGLEDDGTAPRIVFLMVGIWWIGFAQIPFKYLPDNIFNKNPTGNIFFNGYLELKKVLVALKTQPNIKKYLIAFFFFNMGVQTIMLLATLFGTKELGLGQSELIPTILIIQFVAIAGALLFARVSGKKGNIFSLSVMIVIWVGICIYAYTVTTVYEFYLVAALVGLVMGGIQALSRATYSKLVPKDTVDNASYFSFFDITYHLSVVFGTFSYGFIEQLTGSMRNSTLALGAFFIIGFIVLRFVKMPHGQSS
ncbi:MAG: UMF1 family MFS transporter [Cyclobacteriaceae bacterium]|jgi:UMF1 family MFS transporter